jgi:AcrR family transcriptional regulator
MAGRATDEQARATRAAILSRAVDVASTDGFEGITIGRLAGDLSMSKAGILGHFHTKQELQLAALREAQLNFKARVLDPARVARSGAGTDEPERALAWLLEFVDRWSAFLGDPPWPGGCCLAAGSFEFDDRPGAVRDQLRDGMVDVRNRIERETAEAVAGGKLPANTDPRQAAFQISALAAGANQANRLFGDPDVAARTATAMRAALGVLHKPADGRSS